MARLPRFVLPGQPLHVIQRGSTLLSKNSVLARLKITPPSPCTLSNSNP